MPPGGLHTRSRRALPVTALPLPRAPRRRQASPVDDSARPQRAGASSCPYSSRLRLALLVPLLAALPATTFADGVAAGARHALQVNPDGTVTASGSNVYGQLGDGTFTDRPTPVAVSGVTNVTTVAAGAFHSLAVTADGSDSLAVDAQGQVWAGSPW